MPETAAAPSDAWIGLYEATAAFHSTLVSAKVLETIVAHTQRVFNAQGTAIYRLDAESKRLICAISIGVCSEPILPLGEAQRAVLSGEIVQLSGDHSIICAPMSADQFVGMLCVCPMDCVPPDFVWQLRELAEQGASALDHAFRYEALQKAEQQRTEFIHVVTHELRSPVVGAQSLVRVLLQGMLGELTPQQNDIMDRLSRRMDLLLTLINDLLALAAARARIDQPMERLDIAIVVRESADTFFYDAKDKSISLKIINEVESIPVWAAREGLRRILDNLIGNAIKYTPNGGNVTIVTKQIDDCAVIEVIDTGIGIPAGAVARIGELFFRASNAHSSGIVGTGLGLATVKALVDSFDGTLKISSEEGKGTTFTVLLPLTAP